MSIYSSFAIPGEPVKAPDITLDIEILVEDSSATISSQANPFLSPNGHLAFYKEGNIITITMKSVNSGFGEMLYSDIGSNIRLFTVSMSYIIGKAPEGFYNSSDIRESMFLALFANDAGQILATNYINFTIDEEGIVDINKWSYIDADLLVDLNKIIFIPIKNFYMI